MKMDKIKRAVTVYVPGNLCNLRCGYCYVSECLKNGHEERAEFCYPVEHMIKAFRPERIGGLAYFTVIGAGETLLPKEVVPFVHGLLHYGHVVEVVTNNTLNNRIDELLDMEPDELGRLIVKCSLHWNELKRLNKIDDYFENMRKVLAAGASSYPFMVLSEEYMKDLDEICEVCIREIGALPQCTPCVIAETREEFLQGGEARTNPPCTPEFIHKIDETLHSKLFDESVRFLDIDPQKIFCYAGKWAFGVGMGTGILLKCHNVNTKINFFENIEEPVACEPVGCECGIASCSLQYPLFGMGLIPEIKNVPTYTEMVCDREGLFTNEVKALMDVKIPDVEQEMTQEERTLFLMDCIREKNERINNLSVAYQRQREFLEMYKHEVPEEQKLVEEILDKIDSGKVGYGDLRDISYEHFTALYQVCNTMENGLGIYRGILAKIYEGLFLTHAYDDAGLSYNAHEEGLFPSIKNLPVTVIIAEISLSESVKKCLQTKDNEKMAELMQKQICGLLGGRV